MKQHRSTGREHQDGIARHFSKLNFLGDTAGALHLPKSLHQLWYTDDATASGGLPAPKNWWDDLPERGPCCDYFANPSKSWLVVKEGFREKA